MFNKADLDEAIARLGMCEFFPREPLTQAMVMELLAKMCPHKKALEWLTDTMVTRVGKWHGPVELRGVLCTRFKPADGIEANCVSTPGFTPAAMEAKAIEHHHALASGTAPLQIAGDVEPPMQPEELAAFQDQILGAVVAKQWPRRDGPSLREMEEKLSAEMQNTPRLTESQKRDRIAEIEMHLGEKAEV